MPEGLSAIELVPGSAEGPALVLDEPLSFWGGLNAETGRIIDRLHPQHGLCLTSTVLFMPAGRGSSSASSVLTEAIRVGTAPAALVLYTADEILVLGSLVAQELYGTITPVVVCHRVTPDQIATGETVLVAAGFVRNLGRPREEAAT